MKREGLGDHPSFCEICSVGDAPYHCSDCFSSGLSCKDCVVHQHALHPLHRIQVTFCLSFCAALTRNSLSGGTALSSLNNPFGTWDYPINLATTLATHALSPPNPSTSRFSTSQAYIPYKSPTAFATPTMYNLATAARSCFVLRGFRPPGLAPAPSSLFAFSISFISFRQEARSICTTSMLLSNQ
jgi:hypothetical protein